MASPGELPMRRELRTAEVGAKAETSKNDEMNFIFMTPLSKNDTARNKSPEGWSKKATVPQEVTPKSHSVRTSEDH